MTGHGVETIHIEEIEKAADDYEATKLERMRLSEEEADVKQLLIDTINRHRDKLPIGEDGSVSYRYGDKLVTLKPSKEKVNVKSIHDPSDNVTVDED